jgi:hypothetical protein
MSGANHPVGGGAGTPDQLAQTKAWISERAAEVKLIQASASKWQTGTAALLALVTGAVGVGLRSTVIELDPDYSVSVGLLMLGALIFSIIAALLGLYAAVGLPRLVKTSAPVQPNANHQHARVERRMLFGSIGVTVVALLLFVVALTVTWWAPSRPAGNLALVKTSTASTCGYADLNNDQLIITSPNGVIKLVKLTDLKRWKLVNSCP